MLRRLLGEVARHAFTVAKVLEADSVAAASKRTLLFSPTLLQSSRVAPSSNVARGFASSRRYFPARHFASTPEPVPSLHESIHLHQSLPHDDLPASIVAPHLMPQHGVVRAEAAYVGSKINIYDLLGRPDFAGHYKRLHKGTVILALSEQHVPESAEVEGMPLGSYLVATSYGSAVFFNVDAEGKEKWLEVLKSTATEPLAGEKKYHEEYTLAIVPELPSWSQLEPECIRLQALDLRNMQVVAQVLAQSVALDYYSSHVEKTLETFCSMNFEMAESASIAKVDKQMLLRLVAENNIVMTEIISKLGVHERYDIAWKHFHYGRIWEFLRSELEMEPRFKTLDMKLNLIQDNLKYFLEILQARKSDSLEWTIIILIAVEILLSLYELGVRVA